MRSIAITIICKRKLATLNDDENKSLPQIFMLLVIVAMQIVAVK